MQYAVPKMASDDGRHVRDTLLKVGDVGTCVQLAFY